VVAAVMRVRVYTIAFVDPGGAHIVSIKPIPSARSVQRRQCDQSFGGFNAYMLAAPAIPGGGSVSDTRHAYVCRALCRVYCAERSLACKQSLCSQWDTQRIVSEDGVLNGIPNESVSSHGVRDDVDRTAQLRGFTPFWGP
jgi:hypothetical protein